MNTEALRTVIGHVQYPGFKYVVVESEGVVYLQIEFATACTKTGVQADWKSRKWLLSKHMTKSEIVGTAFKATLTALEHEARESFQYKGAAVFGPHFDIERLATLAMNPINQDVR